MHIPLMIQSHIKAGSSTFDATHFYQYMDDHFSHFNLRLVPLMSNNNSMLLNNTIYFIG